MNRFDLIHMGLRNLWRRKTRTILTIMGVVIGTAAIVIMMSLGYGMKYSFQEQVSQIGSVTIIDVQQAYEGMVDMNTGQPMTNAAEAGSLNDKAIAQFKQLEGVQAVTPTLDSYVRIVSGRYVMDVPIRGIDPDFMSALGLKLQAGRLLQQGDEANVVFGAMTLQGFYNPKSNNRQQMGMMMPQQGNAADLKVDVLNDKLSFTYDFAYGNRKVPGDVQASSVKPKLYKIKGVGILQEGQMDSDYTVFMDIGQLKMFIEDNGKYLKTSDPNYKQTLAQQLRYQGARVKVSDLKYVTAVQNKIKEMGFQTYSLNDVLESMKKTSSTLQLILGGIGAISLLVAALGITNTMIMSIYERTREIGIMKVIGASIKDIEKLFLFESGMIGFLGGLLGMGVSFVLSLILNMISHNTQVLMSMGIGGSGSKISVIPFWLVIAVMGLSIIVGLIAGYYPARRAMKLSALEAIRNE
ncbi:ABC transporter permease [Dehalobacter sp. DCM]|uniref:ABC transporter permease n=1 Tax=Dehalobacter sp. DCM TaxID=2907827 RepID=UPI003081D0B3|nr:ABC transporter permease [Dehalobacter sp. DCM]